jgi:hypothetical protein
VIKNLSEAEVGKHYFCVNDKIEETGNSGLGGLVLDATAGKRAVIKNSQGLTLPSSGMTVKYKPK